MSASQTFNNSHFCCLFLSLFFRKTALKLPKITITIELLVWNWNYFLTISAILKLFKAVWDIDLNWFFLFQKILILRGWNSNMYLTIFSSLYCSGLCACLDIHSEIYGMLFSKVFHNWHQWFFLVPLCALTYFPIF